MADLLIWFLFGSVVVVALPLQLLGLPGTWVLVAGAFLLRWLKGPGYIDMPIVGVLFLMAVLAEVLEFLAAVRGANAGPPVKGASVAAIFGAIAGGLAGAPVLFGLGAIPGMAAGAWLAVFAVALAGGAGFGHAARTALGAMAGRIRGTALKMAVAVTMVAVIIMTLVF